jgi:hypothetical protein
MSYLVHGLDPAPFIPLFALDDAALADLGARRVVADEKPGYPCRASLQDAEPGEKLILVSHAHMTVEGSPYRAAGPIFVRQSATGAAVIEDRLPAYLSGRLLSLRAYDVAGIMTDAEVIEGVDADPLIRRFLDRSEVEEVHAHFARRGCFGARITRA